MASRKRHSSTRDDPFGQFREFATAISIDEGIIDGLDLHSGPLNPLLVDWHGLLAGSNMDFPETARALQIGFDDAPVSEIAALISVTATNARIMRNFDAAPLPTEIEEQLRNLHATLRRAGALAQGKKAEAQITATPSWHPETRRNVREQQGDTPFHFEERSRILHPILQDHVSLALQHGRNKIENDFERRLFDAHLAQQQQMLIGFFDTLPQILDLLQKSAAYTAHIAKVLKRERTKGAPPNRAGDWAMVRLMWIWRDVLGREINIYVRRISGPVELDEPEPNACVAFVQSVMERIDPQMLPSNAQNLERKLIELRKEVPRESLILDPSRKN